MSARTDRLLLRAESAAMRFLMGLPPGAIRTVLRRPVVRDDQVLSTELQVMFALQRVARIPKAEELPLEQARREIVHQAKLAGGRQSVGAVRDLHVDGGAGPIPARLYVPSERVGARPAPTMMFIHGGGWMYGDLESHDAECRFLAERSGVQLLAVDYRLSPEHPFPAAVEDVRAAYGWLVKHAEDVNADPSRLAVGGDSAGGNLAFVTAVHAAEEGLPLAFQLLVYPGTDFVDRTPSRREFAEGFFLTERFMRQAQDCYLPEGVDVADPYASILRRTSFPDGLAPAHVVTAGFDPLRDEGEAFARLLEGHGVPVTLKRYPGLIHGFANIVGVGRDCPAAVAEIAARLREAMG